MVLAARGLMALKYDQINYSDSDSDSAAQIICLVPKRVATNIKSKEARALFTHCYDHSLTVAASDRMKTSRIMEDALETIYDITKTGCSRSHNFIL